MTEKRHRSISGFGKSVDDPQSSVTAGSRRPAPTRDVHLLETLGRADRDVIPWPRQPRRCHERRD